MSATLPTGDNIRLRDDVTTSHVNAARRYIHRAGLADLEAMLGIDDQGVADGVARGVWQVAS